MVCCAGGFAGEAIVLRCLFALDLRNPGEKVSAFFRGPRDPDTPPHNAYGATSTFGGGKSAGLNFDKSTGLRMA